MKKTLLAALLVAASFAATAAPHLYTMGEAQADLRSSDATKRQGAIGYIAGVVHMEVFFDTNVCTRVGEAETLTLGRGISAEYIDNLSKPGMQADIANVPIAVAITVNLRGRYPCA